MLNIYDGRRESAKQQLAELKELSVAECDLVNAVYEALESLGGERMLQLVKLALKQAQLARLAEVKSIARALEEL